MTSKRRKPIGPKRRAKSGVKCRPRSRRAVAGSADSAGQLRHERDEALEHQAATSKILSVISRSPSNVQPVLDTIVRAAVKICDSYDAVILLREGDRLRIAAHHGPMTIDFTALPISRDWISGRVVVDRVPIHVRDITAAGDEFPLGSDIGVRLKQRTCLGLPLSRHGEAIGCLFLRRTVVQAYTDRQIALLQTFAEQAVIAIENVRLFGAEQQRSRELSESLEQQTATSEVLKTISSSPGELAPVFDAILDNATRLCEAQMGELWLCETAETLRMVAMQGPPPEWVEFCRQHPDLRPGPMSAAGRVRASKRTIHVVDVKTDDPAATADPFRAAFSRIVGARTLMAVPMLKDDALVGIIVIYRLQQRPFGVKQIELVENFAAQAVIAIENARLLHELREALQQQTATADVLKVISRSTFDLRLVLQTLTESAAHLCEADMACIVRPRGNNVIFSSNYRFPHVFVDLVKATPLRTGRGNLAGRVLAEGCAVHIPDVLADPDYEFSEGQKAAAFRSILGIPLLRGGTPIGVIVLTRLQVCPFTAKQIELVTTFADQAVIAIENVRLFEAEQQRTRELSESLEQQTATSDVLRVISSSTGDLQPVFEAMLQNAVRICGAQFGNLLLRNADTFEVGATHGAPAAYVDFMRREAPFRIDPRLGLGRMLEAKQTYQVADISAAPTHGDKLRIATIELAGARTVLGVPMLKDTDMVGAIIIYRREVREFTGKQIELVQNFAAQAVIAIENARLLNELRQRTDDLTESLEQQTATSEVLKVISSSPGALEPVFNAMLENATRICEAKVGNLFLFDGGDFRAVAVHGDSDYADWFRRDPMARVREQSGSPLDRLIKGKQVIHLRDLREDQSYVGGNRRIVSLVESAGARTHLVVPMLKDRDLVGAIVVYRQEVRPFTDKQIALVQNFAAQAVIAIENARLLSELRQRTDDLSEALEQQTATSEVLNVISRSPTDTQPVFDAIVESAARLCDAVFAMVWLYDGGLQHYAAGYNLTPEALADVIKSYPKPPDRSVTGGRVILDGKIAHVPNIAEDPEYAQELAAAGKWRAVCAVPMLRDGKPVGAISLGKAEPGPFLDRQIQLLTTFADQAVIAIENTRLLSELRESLQQQTATADVLKAISRSAFDLLTVLDALLQSAARLCDAEQGTITQRRGDAFFRSVSHGFSPAFLDYVKDLPVEPGRETGTGRALAEGKVIHIADVLADPDYTWAGAQKLGGFRTLLGVPMLRDGVSVGVLTLTRTEVRPFTDKQIELVSTFADQAAIAIENVRLFEAEQQRRRELAKSLEDLRTAQDRLVQTEKLASLGQLTAGIAHEIKNPLNFVNNFSGVSVELVDELKEALERVTADRTTRADIVELSDTLRDNLHKIVQHGKRADSIVKNMLLHSRQGSGERRPTDINALVEESLNLAYHGARAEKQGFNITLERSLDPAAGEVEVFPQEITRVLLNLIGNGFYAATKRQASTGDGYEPTLAAATKNLGDRVEISIRDNGTGIPAEVKEKMFNPFFTTKPAGEGTGLGLSLSHDIVVKQHSGSIEVETEPGAFTQVRIVLPRTAAKLAAQ